MLSAYINDKNKIKGGTFNNYGQSGIYHTGTSQNHYPLSFL